MVRDRTDPFRCRRLSLDLGSRTEVDRELLAATVAGALAILVTREEGAYPLESRQESSEAG